MGERDDEPTDERVDAAMDDLDDESAETCGGEMIDISVSRE